MKTINRSILIALAIPIWFGACSQKADEPVVAEAGSQTHEDHAPDGPRTLSSEGPWTVTGSDGSHVTLSNPNGSIGIGPLALEISVHSLDDSVSPYSVDLVSPTMPMHGLVRTRVEEGRVEIDIPMEGRWSIYVNLDEAGREVAEFQLDIAAGASGGHVHHGGD